MARLTTSIVAGVFLLVLAGVWRAYSFGLPGTFVFDDHSTLGRLATGVQSIDNVKVYLSQPAVGRTGRPVSQLSYLLDDFTWPSDSRRFKVTNIKLHLWVTCLVFWFSVRLFRLIFRDARERSILLPALFVAALWATHPLHASTVGYVVQRMTQLSAGFSLLAAIAYVSFRSRIDSKQFIAAGGQGLVVLLAGLLALFSKENGALLPLLLLAVECIRQTARPTSTAARTLVHGTRATLVITSLALTIYCAWPSFWINGYSDRPFTVFERLATQPIVLWDYTKVLLTYRTFGLGLLHDDFPVFGWSSWQVAVATGCWIGAIALAVWTRRRFPEILFGMLWFLGGHVMESTAVPLELYFEHRNYLPSVGIVFMLVCLANRALLTFGSSDMHVTAITVGTGLTIGAILLTTTVAKTWSNRYLLFNVWNVEHPESQRSWHAVASALEANGEQAQARKVLGTAALKFPESLSFTIRGLIIDCVNDSLKDGFETDLKLGNMAQVTVDFTLQQALTGVAIAAAGDTCKPLAVASLALIEDLQEHADFDASPKTAAYILAVRATLIERTNGRYSELVTALLDADRTYSTVGVALRIASLQAAAGNANLAQEWLDRARLYRARQARLFRVVDNNDIDVLEARIHAALTSTSLQ